jgi:hypothetical protein
VVSLTPVSRHSPSGEEAGTMPAPANRRSVRCCRRSGFPHQAAKRLIAELEPFDRQLFGGIVGWCDDEGNGEWVVTIRCARLQQRTLRLFAGAGIVLGNQALRRLVREAAQRRSRVQQAGQRHGVFFRQRRRSSQLSLPSSPQLITTPTLWHLATPIEGTALAEESLHRHTSRRCRRTADGRRVPVRQSGASPPGAGSRS